MAIREIIDYNNKLIREKSEEVLKLDDEVKNLIKDMEDKKISKLKTKRIIKK